MVAQMAAILLCISILFDLIKREWGERTYNNNNDEWFLQRHIGALQHFIPDTYPYSNFEYSLYIMTLKLAYTNCVIWREPSFCAVGPLDGPLFSHYLL